MATNQKHRVFAYGTLRELAKNDEATHELWGFGMFDYGKFPYVVPRNSVVPVQGNVIEVDDSQLAELDRYEGVERGLYTRERVAVKEKSTRANIMCFVYVATDKLHPRRIESGDWYNRG